MKRVIICLVLMGFGLSTGYADLVAVDGSGAQGVAFEALNSQVVLTAVKSNGGSLERFEYSKFLDGVANVWEDMGKFYYLSVEEQGAPYSILTIDFGTQVTISEVSFLWGKIDNNYGVPNLEYYADNMNGPAFASSTGLTKQEFVDSGSWWATTGSGSLSAPVTMRELVIRCEMPENWVGSVVSEVYISGTVPEPATMSLLAFASISLVYRRRKKNSL